MPQLFRQSPYSVSVLKGSNKLISSSLESFDGIRPGTMIKVGDNDNLFNITKSSKIFYVRECNVKNLKTLEIENDIGVDLAINDEINISFKEYELNSIIDIVNRGKGYLEGDILTVSGGDGVLSIDIVDGEGTPTKLKVESVGIENQEILSFGLVDSGKYLIAPKGEIKLNGGQGNGASVELKYDIISNRSVLARTIRNIEINEGKTFITLDYSIPIETKKVKLSCTKWEVLLTNVWEFDTARNLNYQLFRDFTPNLQLSLLVKNNKDPEILLNRNFNRLDSEIAVLKEEIKNLKM